MGPWSQLARRVLASAVIIPQNSIALPSGSKGRLLHIRSWAGLWNRHLGGDLSLLKPVTNRGQEQLVYSLLGISAILFWGGTLLVQAEEVGHSSSAATSNEVKDVQLQGQQSLEEADTTEVVSNVHTAKWRVFTDMGRDLFSKVSLEVESEIPVLRPLHTILALGRLDESEKYLLHALEEAKQGFGEKDPHVASSLNNLAELYRMKMDYGKAEPLFLEAIEILEKAFNTNHVSVSFTLHNLAGTYLVQRKLNQARQCYERSLEIKEKALGRQNPEFSNTMFHLGEVLRQQGEFVEAEKLIRESIDILQEGGVGHSQVAIRRMGRLVEILAQTGQLKEAEKLQRKILHNLELSQGVESSNTTTAAENLAGTLQAVGKLEEAEELLQRSFEVRQKVLPPTHIQLGVTMFKLASVSIQRGDELVAKKTDEATGDAKDQYERADQLLRRAISIAERSWKPASAAQGSVAMRAGPLISLLRSLDLLGQLEMKKMELAATPEEIEAGEKEAESLFNHCLSVLDQPGVSQDLASVPEFQRQHVACLGHLAKLLSLTPFIEAKTARKAEADQLLKKSERIQAELTRHSQMRAH